MPEFREFPDFYITGMSWTHPGCLGEKLGTGNAQLGILWLLLLPVSPAPCPSTWNAAVGTTCFTQLKSVFIPFLKSNVQPRQGSSGSFSLALIQCSATRVLSQKIPQKVTDPRVWSYLCQE